MASVEVRARSPSLAPAGGAALVGPAVEAASLHLVSTLVATAALGRRESRGAHRRTDARRPDPAWEDHQVLRLVGGRLVTARSDPGRAA
ncbi:MAG: hypothetical protein ACRDZQ_13460 [Acidimicrobiales bacterium]